MGERVAALAFLIGSAAYLATALGFPAGSAARPGPGLYPLGVGAFLCAVAAAMAVQAFAARPAAGAGPALPRDARARVGVAAGGLVAFCLLLPWAGFPAAAFVFVALLVKRLGPGGWGPALGVALASTAVAYYVFAVLLAVPLPRGPWRP